MFSVHSWGSEMNQNSCLYIKCCLKTAFSLAIIVSCQVLFTVLVFGVSPVPCPSASPSISICFNKFKFSSFLAVLSHLSVPFFFTSYMIGRSEITDLLYIFDCCQGIYLIKRN